MNPLALVMSKTTQAARLGRGRSCLGAGTVLALLAVLPASAWAHGTLPGINQFYNGVLHPLLAPAHLVVLLALALVGGQQGLRPRPWEIIGLALGYVAGAFAAAAAGDPDTDRWLWGLSAAAALSVAIAWRWPRPLRVLLGLGLGLATGVAMGLGSADVKLQGAARTASLAGAGLGLLLIVAYASLGVERLMRWQQHLAVRVGLRVLGSWLGACAVLMLALSLKRAG